jgi:antirestriction protein ArdC
LGRFNDRKAYAFEELVAEIGNCMLCAQIGVEPEFDQSAAYVEGWLEVMKEESRAIFRAASEAQKAVDYIGGAICRVETGTTRCRQSSPKS